MQIQIIPDIHNKWFQAEEIIDKENADKIVFLGDYFDSIGDTLDTTHQTALWLKDSMKKSNRTHLMGNHDLSYFDSNYRCAGFSEGKLYAIRSTGLKLGRLNTFCWVDDWLCTHAGLSYEFYQFYNPLSYNVDTFLNKMMDDEEWTYKLFAVSNYRGGSWPYSGPLWCDYDEFKDIPGIKQIFGHTHDRNARWRKYDDGAERWCIDTWLKYYGLYDTETKEMTIKKV